MDQTAQGEYGEMGKWHFVKRTTGCQEARDGAANRCRDKRVMESRSHTTDETITSIVEAKLDDKGKE